MRTHRQRPVRMLTSLAIAFLASVLVSLSAPVSPAQATLDGCGLRYYQQAGGFWIYTVRNCHDYAVYRRIVFAGGGDLGACRFYDASGGYYDGTSQRRPDHLIGC